ncbi:epimerase [Chitinophaga sp. Mgbs1]|uniref:Epimerase n=1 Tax=Chitinophaga solisilvae TaxID=1233460 RepID=A0A3S1BII0_9BACT|nr:epimerase [Chitinophaga solisilvae]
MKIKAIITGATGMVGEGVLLECLEHPDVEEVLVISRKASGLSHPRMKEIIHRDFFDLTPIVPQLSGYNACFFCLGISSVGVSQEEYRHITYDLTMNMADTLAPVNPDLTFCYVTGAGTDSSEQGRVAWARVKGATENALLKVFKNAYMFRPAFMKPSAGQRNVKKLFYLISWMYPVGRALFPGGFCTIREVALAMIHVAQRGHSRPVLDVKDIVKLAAEKQ